jgi:hypothetical protein
VDQNRRSHVSCSSSMPLIFLTGDFRNSSYSTFACERLRAKCDGGGALQSRRGHQHSAFYGLAFISLVLLTACARAPEVPTSAGSTNEWLEFQGTWTATGSRNIMRLLGDRRASISNFNGSLVLTGRSRPAVGFRSEAIVFNDSTSGLIGRAVWTDEHGDEVYSELRGEGTPQNNKIIGIFVGGTGRYSGVTGTYEFSWRFVTENEDGTLQGQSMGLNGRARLDSQPGAARGGQH